MKGLYNTLTCLNFLIILEVGFSYVLRQTGCPKSEDIAPCECGNSPYTVLNCSRVLMAEDLITAFQKSENYTYKEVHIENSAMEFLPRDMFNHTPVKSLFLKNVTVTTLFDSPPDTLHILDSLFIENSQVLSSMSWELLEPLTELRLLNVYYNPIETLGSEFSKFVTKNLEQVTFFATETRKIETGAFTEFTNLTKIAVDGCKLTTLSRDIFPTPFNVQVLYFNENKITSIPQDLFTQMPHLQTLGLTNNLISVVPEPAFEGDIGRVTYVWLDGNPLKCDCLLQWAIINKPSDLRGKCHSPKRLYGKDLKDLAISDFSC